MKKIFSILIFCLTLTIICFSAATSAKANDRFSCRVSSLNNLYKVDNKLRYSISYLKCYCPDNKQCVIEGKRVQPIADASLGYAKVTPDSSGKVLLRDVYIDFPCEQSATYYMIFIWLEGYQYFKIQPEKYISC